MVRVENKYMKFVLGVITYDEVFPIVGAPCRSLREGRQKPI